MRVLLCGVWSARWVCYMEVNVYMRLKKGDGLYVIPKGCGPMWRVYAESEDGTGVYACSNGVMSFFEYSDRGKSWIEA